MKKSISYYSPINSSLYKELNISAWNSCVDNYEKENHKESLVDFLNYLDPNIYEQYSNPEKTIFTIPHGSSIIILKIENNHLFIEAPFIKLPEAKFIPILRKSSEINFSYMTLPNIKLQDNEMKFVYDMPLELCNPWKLYDILRNITFNADKYDDEFVTKFSAERIVEPMVGNYDNEKLAEYLKVCKEIAIERVENIQHFETKRNLNNAIDSVFIGINQIRLYCNPTGILLNKMDETIDIIYDRSINMIDKLKAGRVFFKFVEEILIEDFNDYCNVTFNLISNKRTTNRTQLESWVEGYLENSEEDYSVENFTESAFNSYYALYYALSYFNIESKDEKVMLYGLQKASQKSWQEAAEILIEVLDFFYQNTGEDFIFKNTPEPNNPLDDSTQNIQECVKQYKNMLSGFLSGFGK
ncbi:hypothetical protein AAYQ05_02635 [Flavobacterium sp. B11]|uniref:hypothetical protein n=1 Tax=Flavobacterium movens TaxID=214860 RepID=UPI0031D2EF85